MPVEIRFEPGLVPVLKHGSHAQLSHGNRSKGGIDRGDMPQIPKTHRAAFLSSLKDSGISYKDETVDPRSLHRTQRAIDPENVKQMHDAMVAGTFKDGPPIIVSSDNKVLDGHHRWAAASQMADEIPGTTINITRVDMKMSDLLGRARRFNEAEGIAAREMGDVRSTVVKFEPGLRPVLKHGDPSRPGYAQMHPNGGTAHDSWGDRATEIGYMKNVGPSRAALENAVDMDYDKIESEARSRISEDYGDMIDEEVTDRIAEDEQVMGRKYSDEERRQWEGDLRQEITDRYVDENWEEYANAIEQDTVDGMYDQFNEVYNVYHTATNRSGQSVEMSSYVESVDLLSGGGVDVRGAIYSSDDGDIGRFERRFQRNRNGELVASHELLEIYNDDYKGLGFASTFNRQAENYYISHGINKIEVHAALENGGYTWAKAGFDWDENNHYNSSSNIQYRMERIDRQHGDSMPGAMKRDWEGLKYRFANLKPSDPDYPMPHELAMFGYKPGATEWVGKSLMVGSNWFGVKTLSPAGRRWSISEQEMAGLRDIPSPSAPGQQTRGQLVLDRYFRASENKMPGQQTLIPPPPLPVENL